MPYIRKNNKSWLSEQEERRVGKRIHQSNLLWPLSAT